MHFNHYGGEAALLAADLVNAYAAPVSTDRVSTAPVGTDPVGTDPESAAGADDPSALLAAHGVVEHALGPAQRQDVRAWARRLADCFGPQDLAERCARVNRLLDDASSRPYIALHDGTPHFHYSAPGADPAAHVRALTAAGLAYIVCHADARRLGRCARAGCGRAFVDTSRAGRRAYCSVRCANNDAVARHRARAR
ncbi:CGNR zinc finger domain-containing protein [Streptomyces sp. NRRL B-1347]|uniref:CGNR zinc finger domain-containing protein n=1 Tax=Streptomyces sp. NRRL B-1347 TaxID=1476877 RepID=UPI0004C74A1F|nr:CGNR zinc finger domain-containing protein [Streptomyces sp. NRRL B-1347]